MFLFLLQGLEKFRGCSMFAAPELYDAGDTFGIVPAFRAAGLADLAVDLSEALIVSPTADRSAGRAEARHSGMAEPESALNSVLIPTHAIA